MTDITSVALEDGATAERAIGGSDCVLAGEAEEDIRMTEEEGMEVDVHTPDKALPGIKMKGIVLNSLQKKTQAKSNVLENPPHGSSMRNQISCFTYYSMHQRTPLKG